VVVPTDEHPVQFERPTPTARLGDVVACTVCGAVVLNEARWRDQHRTNHDAHNKIHADLEAEARRYKSPPTYGGR
jgi:hypothetical protein